VDKFTKNSGQMRSDRWKRCRWHPPGGWHPNKINKSDSSDEQKKVVSFFCEKMNRGDAAELADGDD